MNLESKERAELIFYLCARSVKDFAYMGAEDKKAEYLRMAPLLYPLLEALPENCTHADLDRVDFSASAAVTLVMLGREQMGDLGVTDEEIHAAITADAIRAMASVHLNFARLLLDPIADYTLLQAASHSDLDAELALLTGDQ